MRRILVLLMLSLLPFALHGQKADAVILSDEETFTLQSSSEGRFRVRRSVQVNGEDGLPSAAFFLYTDSFTSLSSFKGEIQDASGKKTAVRQSELKTVSISSGLADDSYVTTWAPTVSCPFTVTYDYTVSYKKGVISFPVFAPVRTPGTVLLTASFTLDLPAGTEIVRHGRNVSEPVVTRDKKRTLYRWSASLAEPVVVEHDMPLVSGMVPVLHTAPVSFSYAGTTGSQSGWKESGRWLYSLQDGADALPEEEVTRVRALTEGCGSDLEKIRAIYSYFRDRTRYVSIQLGIGGLKPIAAAEVSRTGFGDCKALSNYMKALLKAAGIASDYYIINTEDPRLLPDFPAVGQMDHAMLAVPLPELQDTLFIECTNPRYPLGYRHEDAAGHEVVLIKPEGGERVRIGPYPDSLSRTSRRTEVFLAADGSARLSVTDSLFLDRVEPYLSFSEWPVERRNKRLSAGMNLQAEHLRVVSVGDNFLDYDRLGRRFCPRMEIAFTLDTGAYANVSGDRMFIPSNPVSQGLAVQKGARKNDLVIDEPYASDETILVHIPEGYRVESLPEAVEMKTGPGSFRASASVEGDTVVIRQSARLHRCRIPKEEYGSYLDFARSVNRYFRSSVVLRRD